MKNPVRNTKFYFLELLEKEDVSTNKAQEKLPKIKHFSKVHDEISRYQTEFKYCIFHTHEHLEIFYIEKGKGVFETKTQKVHIKANDIIVVNKGAVHRIYSEEEPLEYFNLATFNVQVGDNRLDTVSKGEFEKISFKSKENNIYSIMRRFEILAKKEKVSVLRAYSVVYEILDVLISTLKSRNQNVPKEVSSRLTEKIKNYILENYDKDLLLEELSKRFFISKSHLGHTFKKEYGVSPVKFLIKTRVEQAKVLLLCTSKSITEISNEVGFSNPNYFAYYFQKLVGKTPSEFRKTSSEK